MSRELFSQLAFEARRFRDLAERGLVLLDHRAEIMSIRAEARARADVTRARLAELELAKTDKEARDIDQQIRALFPVMQRHTKQAFAITQKDITYDAAPR